jgi:hypothetical protein
VRVLLDDERLEIRLAPWEKALGLMGDISIRRQDIADVRVLEDGLGEAMGAGMKVGLRIPYVRFIARTISLDRAFLVRRGTPALSFTIHDGGRLQAVVVSTPRAGELAAELGGATG